MPPNHSALVRIERGNFGKVVFERHGAGGPRSRGTGASGETHGARFAPLGERKIGEGASEGGPGKNRRGSFRGWAGEKSERVLLGVTGDTSAKGRCHEGSA